MSEEKRIITGIDIGTTKIAVVIAEWSDKNEVKIMGVGKSTSNGLKKGVVINIDKTVESISSAIKVFVFSNAFSSVPPRIIVPFIFSASLAN